MGPMTQIIFILLNFMARQSAQITLLRTTLTLLPTLPPSLRAALRSEFDETTSEIVNDSSEKNFRRLLIAFAEEARRLNPDDTDTVTWTDALEEAANSPTTLLSPEQLRGDTLGKADSQWCREALDQLLKPPPPSLSHE